MRNYLSLLFLAGLAFLLFVIAGQFEFGMAPMLVGSAINQASPEQVGAANIVTSVVLGYRAIDTLGELAILFAAATAGGLVLGHAGTSARHDPDAGFILRAAADVLFPLLLMVGLFIIVHGHLTPGGGFQGGVILAAAFFLPLLARPGTRFPHGSFAIVEGIAGAAFIVTGLLALLTGGEFLQPLLGQGEMGGLLSAGTLPLLYIAVGLKVGTELAGLMAHIAEYEALDP
ncbi:MAG: sodium:proton antiporter [Gammaproteobacteria bacterium]|nr:sodium:proton antiporter [Gammaproteobacteria bacterium]